MERLLSRLEIALRGTARRLAWQYGPRLQVDAIDLEEDLYQTGRVAVVMAVSRYDPTRTKVTTYFEKVLRGEMRKYLRDRVLPVRIPAYLQERKYATQPRKYGQTCPEVYRMEEQSDRCSALTDPTLGPEEIVLIRAEIQSLLGWLPLLDRCLLWWAYAEGVSNPEIAQWLHTSPAYVSVRKGRLLRQVRERAMA